MGNEPEWKTVALDMKHATGYSLSDLFEMTISDYDQAEEGSSFKMKFTNLSKETLEFRVVNFDKEEVSPTKKCKPSRRMVLQVQKLMSWRCILQYRGVV